MYKSNVTDFIRRPYCIQNVYITQYLLNIATFIWNMFRCGTYLTKLLPLQQCYFLCDQWSWSREVCVKELVYFRSQTNNCPQIKHTIGLTWQYQIRCHMFKWHMISQLSSVRGIYVWFERTAVCVCEACLRPNAFLSRTPRRPGVVGIRWWAEWCRLEGEPVLESCYFVRP